MRRVVGPNALLELFVGILMFDGNSACVEARREFAFKEAASKMVKTLKKGKKHVTK